MKKLSVTLPDGKIETRTTEHDYKFVCAFHAVYKGNDTGWGAQWSKTLKGAQTMERKWNNASNDTLKVETKIITIE